MELRSCGNLHYIQAIRGGSTVKILNVTRGRPRLKFKEFIDIYGSSKFDNNVKVARSCISEVERRTVNSESDADACNANDGDEDNNVLEDCNFGNLTLKQIQERCKSQKRKHSQGLGTSKRKIKTEASSSEEHCIENHIALDDSEFMETLSSWRSKLSKDKKAKKRKCIKDQVSTVTQEVTSVVKSEVIQNSQESLSSSENSTALVEVKVEVPESDWSDPWRMLCNTSNSLQACCWPDDSLGIVAMEEPEPARECVLGYELDYEWKEYVDVTPLQIVWNSNTDVLTSDSKLINDQSQNLPAVEFESEESEECVMQPSLDSISSQTINLDKDQNIDIYSNQPDSHITVTPLIANEDIHCVDLDNGGNDAFFSDCSKAEYTSVSEHGCNPDGPWNCGSDGDGSPDESQDCSSDDSSVSEEKQLLTPASFNEERHASEATDEPISWESHQSSSPDESQDCSSDDSPVSEEKQLLTPASFNEERHASEATDEPLSWESHQSSSPDESQDCSSDDSLVSEEKQLLTPASFNEERHASEANDEPISWESHQSSSPDESQDCSSDDSPVSEEKQLLTPASFNEERHASEATDEPISWESHQSSSKMHRPQRLLSGRKIISPSSQLKLCKAMQSINLHDKEYTTCKGKLLFGEQTDDEKKDTTEELDVIEGAQFTKHCNKIRKIPKPVKRVSLPQGVQKSSLPSRSASRLSTGLTSMQSCARSAILFSQRQMHDAECLALKLTNELKSMKDIMATMLRSELCLTTPLRYKVNEARMAVKRATRAEETAKRSLSLMARDCNRFCKLMQLADESSSASQVVVRNNNKSNKKIAFADEAGGRLCQVRFYENEEGALVESDRKEVTL